MLKIDTMNGHERMSTQDLLLQIEAAVQNGETDFEIVASGQHDIGGPLWHPEGKTLHFHITNAGHSIADCYRYDVKTSSERFLIYYTANNGHCFK